MQELQNTNNYLSGFCRLLWPKQVYYLFLRTRLNRLISPSVMQYIVTHISYLLTYLFTVTYL